MKLNKDNLYWTNKKHTTYAVLVSPGYGCGWSTWNKDELAYDRRVVEYVINHKKDKKQWESDWQLLFGPGICKGEKEFKKFLNEIGYDSDSFCYSGIRTIEVRKVDINAIWSIKVSDGHEELQIVNVNENEWKICGSEP